MHGGGALAVPRRLVVGLACMTAWVVCVGYDGLSIDDDLKIVFIHKGLRQQLLRPCFFMSMDEQRRQVSRRITLRIDCG